MKKKLRVTDLFKSVFIIALLGCSQIGFGQVTIFSENIGNITGTVSITSNTFQNSGLNFNGTADTRSTQGSSGYTGASGGRNVYFASTTGTYFTISNINSSSYSSLNLTFGFYKSSTSNISSANFVVEVCTDYNPVNNTGIFSALSFTTVSTGATYSLVSTSGLIPSSPTLAIRFRQNQTAQQIRIDDIQLRGVIANSAPTALGVNVSGTTNIGQSLTGNYSYNDTENDPQGTSTYKWYRADNASGTNEVAISGATGLTYALVGADLNKFVRFAVVPVASSGNLTGLETFSSYVGPITSNNNSLSTISSNSSFTPTSNINYASFVATDVTSSSLEIARFDINDVAGSPNDGLSTILNAINFSVSNFANLDKIALYDGVTEIQEVNAGATISFTGLTLEALSNGSKTFSLRATFNSTVTDNQQIQVSITSANATSSGSLFALGNAGGASSSITSDENRIEVTATSLLFNQEPSNVALNAAISPAPTVEAYDDNVNLDLDFNNPVVLSISGATFGASATTSNNAINGIATFSNLVFDNPATGVTIEGSSTGLVSTGNSNSFNIEIPPAGVLLLEENFNFTGALTSNGFNVHSGGTTNVINTTSGLIYDNYASSGIGNAAFINDSGQDVNKVFQALSAGQTVYCSFLVNVSAATAIGDYFFNLGPSVIGSIYRSRVFVKANGENIQFGVSNDGGVINYSSSLYNKNESYLVVLKFTYNGATALSNLYINPNTFNEPVSPDVSDSDDISNIISTALTEIGSLALRQGTATNAATLTIDEIRVGTGWGAVLGNPIYDSNSTINAGTYNNVTLLNNTLQTNGVVKVYNSLNVNGGTFNTNDNLVLASTATNTAQVAPVSGTISGNVTVERYIPAKRGWRLLAAPLKGTTNNTIASNWKGTANEGALLFSPATYQSTPMIGYTTGGTAPNIFKYGTAWQIIPDLGAEQMFGASNTDTNAYQIFVTGPSNSTNIASGSAATTLRPKGELITGTVNHSLAANTFKLLANPYASPLNTVSLVQANSGSKVWLLDPTVGIGAYVTYDGSNWSIPTPTGTDVNIQSGQGFFVRTPSASTFSIQESNKIAGNSNTWFEKNASSLDDKIRVLLYKQQASDFVLADGILAVNSSNGNTSVDSNDAGKISNFNESLLFRNGTSNLSIEYRALPIINEVQAMRLTGTTATAYQLRLYTENYSNSTLVPMLEDTQTGTFTPIPTDGSIVTVPFTGVASSSNNPDNRFRIVYQGVLSNDSFASLSVSVYPNPINEGFVNINLPEAGNAKYSMINLLGQKITEGTLEAQNNQVGLSNLQSGIYVLTVEQSGKRFATKVVIK